MQFDIEQYLRFNIKKHITASGTVLLYYENCSAGGEIYNSTMVDLVKSTGKKYQRAHEWCCGHGAHGFEILNRGISESLCLSDRFLPAVIGCEFTATLNDFDDRVDVYQSFDLNDLPESEKWDLIVADPPHLCRFDGNPDFNEDAQRQVVDQDWQSHWIFFQNIKTHMLDDADIFLLEGKYGSSPETFENMINECGLQIVDVFDELPEHPTLLHYIMHIKAK